MISYDSLKNRLKTLWETCTIRPGCAKLVESRANIVLSGKSRYLTIESSLGVPWQAIGVIHNMEGGCRWDTYLGNGQLLSKKTTIVPIGRGPFKTWEEGAIDAINNEKRWKGVDKDTPIEYILYLLESYNGFGYEPRGINSPYLWSMTNHYGDAPNIGKYVGDGVFDPHAISKQVGCAAVLKLLWSNN